MVAQNICNGLITPASWEQCFNDEDSFKLDVRGPAIVSVLNLIGVLNRLNLFLDLLIFL